MWITVNRENSVLHFGLFLPPASRTWSIITHFCLNHEMSAEPRSCHKVEDNTFSETNEILYFLFWPSSEQEVVWYSWKTAQNALRRKDVSRQLNKSIKKTINTLKNMRNGDHILLFFFETEKKIVNKINQIEDPALPTKRKRPNYSIVIHVKC